MILNNYLVNFNLYYFSNKTYLYYFYLKSVYRQYEICFNIWGHWSDDHLAELLLKKIIKFTL